MADPGPSTIVAASDLDSLRRVTMYSLAAAVVIAVVTAPAYFAAFGWDIEAAIFGEPSAILGGGASAAALLRWGAIGDMFYSYLLLAPLALFLHRRLRPRMPWLADVGTAAGFAYIVIGGSAAAILSAVGPALIEAHAAAPPADRASIATSFDVLRHAVFFGVWQTLDPITAGTWVSSVGWLMLNERRILARVLVVGGAGLMALSGLTVLGVHSLALLAGAVVVVLTIAIVWIVLDRGRARGLRE